MKLNFLRYIALCITTCALAQSPEQLNNKVQGAILDLASFVAIPNDAIHHNDILTNISWLETQFNQRGFTTKTLETSGEPLFFAELAQRKNVPTLLFYMHFDGQSVDATKWDQENPYTMVLKKPNGNTWENVHLTAIDPKNQKEWRLFGRSTSDDKGPIVLFLHAIDLLKETNATLPYNIKIILDSEEEKSSKPLPEAVKRYKDVLAADFLIINDGPVHPSGKPTIIYGCRGITTLSLTTYGAIVPQHSGHYGNYAPNPALQLAQLLASMKDAEGRVLIPEYYDGISITNEEQRILKSVPDSEANIVRKLQINTPDKVGAYYQEALQYPSLNIRGLASGWVGKEARTIVPATATAELDLRLVPETDGNRLKSLVKKFIGDQGFYVIDHEPTSLERASHSKIITVKEGNVAPAFRTPLSHPFGGFLQQILKNTFEEEVVQIRIMGGTVPIAPFINELGIPAFIVPLVNADNNQHSPNENLKIAQLYYGIQTFYSIMSTPYSNN